MSVFPNDIDDDTTIIRVDDRVTEISGQNFNQARDAIFRIEEELGINPSGSMDSLAEFLGVSFNSNGTIKQSALASVGLVTLPIDNNDVGVNAGILESKLTLDYSTASLRQLITDNAALLVAIKAVTDDLLVKINSHIAGGPASDLRHVASHIDINNVTSDSRDPLYVWSGLVDTDGNQRSATEVATALSQINNEIVNHINSTSSAHTAGAVSVDTTNFTELSVNADNVQSALEELDAAEELRIGIHRAIMHSAGVPSDARSQVTHKVDDSGTVAEQNDGYGETVVKARQVQTYVAAFPGTSPVDSVTTGDKVIRFVPPTDAAEQLVLDSEFSQVVPGDRLTVRYGDGYNFEATYIVESLRYVPGSDYFVRVASNNLLDTTDAYARIDRPKYDPNVYGIAVVAPSNATPIGDFPGFYSSLTVADPRCASVLGIGFDPNQIDSNHYKLYLQLYPNGNPADKAITLPAIDVTGDAGASPGQYTLDSIVLATNNAFREAGYNYRFLAFQYDGNFGIALADPFNGAAFSIVSGDWSSGSAAEGSFTENVIGEANPDGFNYDGLGLNNGGHASPAYRSSFVDETDAQNPTKLFYPRKERYYVANGSRRDFLRSAVGVSDGYWDGYVSQRVETVNSVETSYTIEECLDTVGLEPGKTITVLPNIEFTDPLYNDNDYGRFIIKSVVYQPSCPGETNKTIITVINGVHGAADPKGTSSGTELTTVRIHFGNDTVGFDLNHMIDGGTPAAQDYHRHHEIYVDQNAKTFSHERARMPIQAASGDNLGTDNWHINYVSPKLRGYRDDSTDLNKYVRFKVVSYDSTSGEFEVQLGQRPTPATGTTVNNPGETVKGRKNVPFRVYDETGNDFIELEYVEVGSSATTINTDKIVDIELFPSLALDDEVLLIATAELNWDPSDNLLVQRVIDRRQVGSVSETEFTQSAKDFITAGDRALHSNGVVRDLEFVQINPSNDAELIFNGGIALVNGYIVTANNGTVVIPELVETGGSSGSTVDWIVCLNELGNFVTYPLTTTKQHFFAEAGTGGGTAYFLPSVTFSEVVNERKDLVPLLTLTATITSVAISDTKDVRRFVANHTNNIPLVWTQDGYDESSSFRSSNALVNWLTLLNNENSLYTRSKVTVRGDLVLESELDLSSVPNLVLEADSLGAARISVYADTGLKLGSNATLRNIKFVHIASSSAPSNIVGISTISPNACILVEPSDGATVENINIENCEFTGQSSSYRFPFIYFALNNNILKNVNVVYNKFIDGTATTSAGVVVAEKNGGDGVTHSILDNVLIENNVGDGDQGIFVVNEIDSGNLPSIASRGLYISRNRCGYIGINSGSSIDGAVGDQQTATYISDNICKMIYAPPDTTGVLQTDASVSNVIISHNSCANIYIRTQSNEDPIDGESSITVEGNLLTKTDVTAPSGTSNIYAIYLQEASSNYPSDFLVTNNRVQKGATSSSTTPLTYTDAIVLDGQGSITGNAINGFTRYGVSVNRDGIIISNNVFRREDDISRYITAVGNDCVVTNNSLDNTTIDGLDTETINVGSGSVVFGNKNHVQTMDLRDSQGNFSWVTSASSDICYNRLDTNSINWQRRNPSTHASGYGPIMSHQSGVSSTSDGYWAVSLSDILPLGATVTEITLTASSNALFDNVGDITLQYVNGTTITTSTALSFATTTTEKTRTVTPNKVVGPQRFEVLVWVSVDSTTSVDVDIEVEVTYRE